MMIEAVSPKTSPENWYVAYTKRKKEFATLEKLQKANISVYLPIKKEIKQWSDRKKTVNSPLLSGFIFIYCEAKDRNNVFISEGIIGYLSRKGVPVIVRDREIELLRMLESNNATLLKRKALQSKGQVVEIVKGVFAGQKGTFLHTLGKYEVVIELDSINMQLKVNTQIDHLKFV